MPLTAEQLEVFPESVRDWDEIKNSDSVEIVWDRFANMRSKMGTALFAPGEDAGNETLSAFDSKAVELSQKRLMTRPDLDDEEQRNALFTQLGRPDDPSGYELAEVEGSDLPDDRKEFITKLAHKVGLTKTQLKALDKEMRESEVSQTGAQLRARDEKMKELKTDWGLSFDDRVHMAKKVAAKFFPDVPAEQFTAAELMSFHKIGKSLGSTAEFREQEHENAHDTDPQEARAQINEIRSNPEHPYFDRLKPGFAEARAKMSRLYKVANNIAPQVDILKRSCITYINTSGWQTGYRDSHDLT